MIARASSRGCVFQVGHIERFNGAFEAARSLIKRPRFIEAHRLGVFSARGTHGFTARAGHHLAPQPLSGGDNVFAKLGDGYTLLALDAADASIADFVRAAELLRVPLKVVRDSRADGRERYAARCVLIRPDQFVAWAGTEEHPDALGVLNKAIGAA
jgi:hypothetical protein